MAEPIDEHVNLTEIARRCGVERQAVYGWTLCKGFPEPAPWVTGVRVWSWREVMTWRITR